MEVFLSLIESEKNRKNGLNTLIKKSSLLNKKREGKANRASSPSLWGHIQRKLTKLPENKQATQRGTAS